MPRRVPEWIGKTADSPIPDRVKLRIWEREGGRCYLTGRKIRPGDEYDYEHVIAVVMWAGEGHGNRESNIRLALRPAHKIKTAEDRRQQAKSDRIRKRHLGIRPEPTLRGAKLGTGNHQHTATRKLTKGVGLEFFQEPEHP